MNLEAKTKMQNKNEAKAKLLLRFQIPEGSVNLKCYKAFKTEKSTKKEPL